MDIACALRGASAVTYEVDINNRTRRVDVERAAAGFIVTLDGQRHVADVTLINGIWSVILDATPSDTGLRRSYEVAVAEQPPGSGRLTVHVDGRLVSAAVAPARRTWTRRRHDTASASAVTGVGPQPVIAPMPGKVVKVLVGRGDVVAARQGVVVVEAMKMENELGAPMAGTVVQINVSEGSSVEAGAVLALIE
jgi:biotin carboxyl carrier protein